MNRIKNVDQKLVRSLMIEKVKLADYVSGQIGQINNVIHVETVGSLKSKSFDMFSDIDLVVELSHVDISLIEKEIRKTLSRKDDILIYDWATSLMPNKYVVTYFFRSGSLYNFVDLEFVGEFVVIDKLITNSKKNHLLKLLILNIKKIRRDSSDDFHLDKLYNRIFGSFVDVSTKSKLQSILDYITNEFDINEVKDLIAKCGTEISKI